MKLHTDTITSIPKAHTQGCFFVSFIYNCYSNGNVISPGFIRDLF